MTENSTNLEADTSPADTSPEISQEIPHTSRNINYSPNFTPVSESSGNFAISCLIHKPLPIKTHQKKNRPEPPPSRQPYSSLVNLFVIKTRLVAIIRDKTTYKIP